MVELDESGNCILKVDLDKGILWSWHTIEVDPSVLPQGCYIVCHGYYDEHNHTVSVVRDDGRKICSYGGIPGSDVGQLYVPYHLAVDRGGFLFVADHHNGRVLVLSLQDMGLIGCVALVDAELRSRPRRVFYDLGSQLLYVGEDEGNLVVLSF